MGFIALALAAGLGLWLGMESHLIDRDMAVQAGLPVLGILLFWGVMKATLDRP